jgi:hypothetical protein
VALGDGGTHVVEWYREAILETGRSGVLFMLISFVITFAITRGVTRHIRSKPKAEGEDEKGLVGDIHIGGVHVHHQVWGILLILVAAALEFFYQPDSPWVEVLGATFGAGAALTLDEFALWVHLDDVYWSTEGRKSIDAVIIAACIGVAMLLGSSPFGVDDAAVERDGLWGATAIVVGVWILAILTVLKGKLTFGLVGLFIPVFSLVGAFRLAKPDSVWARRRYRKRPKKMARAVARFEGKRRERMERFRDLIGGAPTTPEP